MEQFTIKQEPNDDNSALALHLDLPDPFAESSCSGVPSKKSRRSFTIDYKMRLVREAKATSVPKVARANDLDESMLRKWVQQEKTMIESSKDKLGKKRLGTPGRTPMNRGLEEELYRWIVFMFANNNRVTRKVIQEKARDLFKDYDFNASVGWCTRFIERYGICLGEKQTISHAKQIKPFREPKVSNIFTLQNCNNDPLPLPESIKAPTVLPMSEGDTVKEKPVDICELCGQVKPVPKEGESVVRKIWDSNNSGKDGEGRTMAEMSNAGNSVGESSSSDIDDQLNVHELVEVVIKEEQENNSHGLILS